MLICIHRKEESTGWLAADKLSNDNQMVGNSVDDDDRRLGKKQSAALVINVIVKSTRGWQHEQLKNK